MPTLYEIADAREILEAWLAETEGEVTPELEELLAELDGDADAKIERVALFVREQLAEAEMVKVEEQRLAARRKAREKAAESLKAYLHREMERLGKTTVKGRLATVAFQKNPPSVRGDVAPETLRAWWTASGDNAGFIRYTAPSFALDRRVVLDAFKAGQSIPDGLTVEQDLSLRIR